MGNSEQQSQVNNAYNTAINLWRLASEQIYSRFAAMLTANSIVVAATILAANNEWPKLVPIILTVAGFLLCVIWALFNKFAIKTEKEDMEKARKIEKKHILDEFRMVPQGYRGFDILSYLTIVIFVVIHLSLLFFHIIANLDFLSQ